MLHLFEDYLTYISRFKDPDEGFETPFRILRSSKDVKYNLRHQSILAGPQGDDYTKCDLLSKEGE